MNDKNKELLLSDDSEYDVTITLSDGDGNDFEAEIIASMEIEDKEYIAVLPTETPADMNDGEVIILNYSEDESGEPVFSAIEDDDELVFVGEAFNDFFNQMAEEEDDDEDITDNYLDDIGDIIPGISIEKDK